MASSIGVFAIILGLLSVACQFIPVEYGLPAKFQVSVPSNELDEKTFDDPGLDELSFFIGKNGYPLVITPKTGCSLVGNVDALASWIKSQQAWLHARLLESGGIVLRGFDVESPPQFEQVSLALEPSLESKYLGTSPRNLVENCTFVHTASEFPGWRIIPAHLEMSFRPNPPRRIFFFAHSPNHSPGGETPLIDFRQVWRDMDKDVQETFTEKKVRYIRQYYSDQWEGMPPLDPFKTKSWQSMFETDSVSEVERACEEQGFGTDWSLTKNGEVFPAATLKLTNTMEPTRTHPVTGELVWSNHLNVLHSSSTPAEFAFSAVHLRSWKYVFLFYAHAALEAAQHAMFGIEGLGQHTTHADGVIISDEHVDHVRHQIWRNTFVGRHQKGDIVMLDNWRIGHARQPYSGPRSILTTWA